MQYVCSFRNDVVQALKSKQEFDIDNSIQELDLASCQLGEEDTNRLVYALERNNTLTSLNLASKLIVVFGDYLINFAPHR